TIPVGLTGLLFEHPLRTRFAKPLAAGIFLTPNRAVLLAAEPLRRRSAAGVPVAGGGAPVAAGPGAESGRRRAPLAVGAAAGVAAYLAVRFLVRWFHPRTLTPFGIYCLVAGVLAVVRFH